jgi:hypothetical protein
LVVCSIRSMLFFIRAEIARASYLAIFSNPCWFFVLTTYLNSSSRGLCFVTSAILDIKMQKSMNNFSLILF